MAKGDVLASGGIRASWGVGEGIPRDKWDSVFEGFNADQWLKEEEAKEEARRLTLIAKREQEEREYKEAEANRHDR